MIFLYKLIFNRNVLSQYAQVKFFFKLTAMIYLCKFIITNKTEKTFSPTLPDKTASLKVEKRYTSFYQAVQF